MEINFSIKSSTHYLAFVRKVLPALVYADHAGNIDHKAVSACRLSLVEAVNNAIFHAHKKDASKWIKVSVRISDSQIIMDVVDSGLGFKLSKEYDLPKVDGTHGRGLFLIRSFMADVKYLKQKNKNVLRMTYQLER